MATIDRPKITLDEGKQALENKQLDEALQTFTSITEAEPSSGEAWYLRGSTLNRMERLADAIASLQKSVELEPGRADAYIEMGQAQAALGDLPAAMAALTKATELQPENAGAWVWLALVLERSGDLSSALDAWEKALTVQPELGKQPNWLSVRARVLRALGRHGEAAALTDQALAVSADSDGAHRVELLASKSNDLIVLGRAVEALEALETADNIAPDDATRSALAFGRGVAYNHLGRFDEAIVALKRALELLPDLGPAVSFDGLVHFQLGQAQLAKNPTDALTSFRQVLEITADRDPSNVRPAALAFTGVALNALGRFQEALDSLTKAEPALGHNPVADVARLHLGIALNALGQHESALARFDGILATLRSSPKSQLLAPASFHRAIALSGLKRWDEALAELDELAHLAPAFAATIPVWMTRGGVLMELGRIESLLEPQPAAIADHPMVLAYQGSVLFLVRGDMAGAMQLFEKAVKAGVNDQWPALGWLGYAMCTQWLNRPTETVDALDNAVKLDPSLVRNPLVAMMRGQALNLLDRHEEALKTLESAPDLEATWVARGLAHASLNQLDDALRDFDRALALAKASGLDRPLGSLYAAVAAVQKGLVLLRQGDAVKALESYDLAIEASKSRPDGDPNRVLAILGKGLALSRLERGEAEQSLKDAAIASRALSSSFPSRGLAWMAFGNFLVEKSRSDEAINAFDEALALESDSVSAFVGRATARLQIEDFERAEADFSAAISHAKPDEEQDRFDAIVGVGQAQNGQGRYDDAALTFRKALAAASPQIRRMTSAWLGLGGAYQGLGRQQAALRAFQNGWYQDARPKKSRELALGVCAVLLDLKRDDEARTFLEGARQVTAADGRLDFNLGIAHYKLKDIPKARDAWERAAKHELPAAKAVLEDLRPAKHGTAEWLDYWFGSERGFGRWIAGGLLLGLLGLALIAPLISPGVIPWLNTGKDWSVTVSTLVVLVVLLLIQSIGKLNVSKDSIEIEIVPVQPQAGTGKGSLDSVLGRLQAIGPALIPAVQPESVPKNLGTRDAAVAGGIELMSRNAMMMPMAGAAIANK